MLSQAAFNAFLKTLEEPPAYVVFILATTEKHKIIPTILSRCQIFDFHRITIQDMIDHLSYVAAQEGITAEPSALNVIAQKADGAMRDALSIFDQVAASSGGNITYQSAIDNLNVLDYDYYDRLLDAFLEKDVLKTWLIYKEIRDNGFDSLFFINGLAGYLRDLMVARDPQTLSLIEAGDEVKARLALRAAKCDPAFLYRAMSLCNDADLNYRTTANKQFLIELTLAKICQPFGPSHSDDGSGEGQLKKIAVNPATHSSKPDEPKHTTESVASVAPTSELPTESVAPAPQPSKLTSEPIAPVRTQVQTPVPQAQRRPIVRQTIGGGPRISIRHGIERSDEKKVVEPQTMTSRNNPFSSDALAMAWEAYTHTIPTAHILVNTMRAAPPQPESPTSFVIFVQNQMQAKMMSEKKPEILHYLRNSLQNDTIDYRVEIHQGADPRHTVSDAELLARMAEEYPSLDHLIRNFQLKMA